MRIGIVVDAACDLPPSFIERHKIVILPITVRIGNAVFPDQGDREASLNFLEAQVAERAAEAETLPYSVAQIRDLFLHKLVIDYDHVFCLTIAKSRSPIYANAMEASFGILNDYKAARQAAGLTAPFTMRVIDTQNVFIGQAILAYEAVRLRDAGENVGRMRTRLEVLAESLHGYLLPRDLYYLRTRTRAKGDRSVGRLGAMLGSALDVKPLILAWRGTSGPVAKLRGFGPGAQRLFRFTADRVRAGLHVPVVALGYGGHLDEMRQLPGYTELIQVCQTAGVEVLETVMSLTGMINVGKGCLEVGFAADKQAFP